MPLTHDSPQLTIYRNGQAKLSDKARRIMLGKLAIILSAPSTIGSRWLLLPVDWTGEGAQTIYDDRGHKRFGAYPLAASLFAMLPSTQKSIRLALERAPLGFWLVPSGEVPQKTETVARAA